MGFTYVNSDTDRMQHNVKESDEIYLSQDETRQDNADKDNETTSETVDDNKDDSNSEPDDVYMEQKIIQIIPSMECWQ